MTDYLINCYPNLEVELELMDFVALRNSLLDNRLDFCVTTSNDWELWPGVQATVLQRKQFQVVYSSRHPLARCSDITLEALAQHTQLVLPNENLLEGVEQWGRKIPFRRAVFCPDISSLMVRLELGEGFALLTKVIEGHDAPNLHYWDIPFPEAHAEIVCICSEHADDAVKQVICGIRGNELVKI